MKVSIINNTASQGMNLGRVLHKTLDADVKYFITKSTDLIDYPDRYVNIGKTLGIPFSRKFKKAIYSKLFKTDLEILNAVPHSYNKADKTIIWWHGSDIRERFFSPRNYSHKQYCSTPDMLKLDTSAYFTLLHRIVDLELFKPPPFEIKPTEKLVVGVFPSSGEKSEGTIKMMKMLKKAKTKFDIEIITNETGHIPHALMPRFLQRCDLILDQYKPKYGGIGVIGLEALAMNVTPIVHLREDGIEDDKLFDHCVQIDENGIDFDSYKGNQLTHRAYVKEHHSGEKTLYTLIEDGIIEL